MAEEFTPINTQEEFNERIAKRLERERRTIEERFADYDALKEANAGYESRITELGNNILDVQSQLQERDAKIADLQKQNAEYVTNTVKMRIANEYGLDAEIANSIAFNDEESFRDTAKKIAERMSQTTIKNIALKSPADDIAISKTEAMRNMLSNLNI